MKPSTAFKVMIPMHTFLEEKETERFQLTHDVVTQEDVQRMKLKDRFNNESEYEGFTEGTYVVLRDKTKKEIIMSDTWMEWKTNFDFLNQAKGDVIIAGLGIGMVLMALQDKESVTSITIIEKEQDIIDMVSTQLPLNKKVRIIHSDIFDYVTAEKFDTIYFDIWNNIGEDNFPDMDDLHTAWKDNVSEHGWMSSWRYEDCYDPTYLWNRNKSKVRAFDDR